MSIENLKAQLVQIHDQADAIRKAAEAQDRPLTEDEKTQINAKLSHFSSLEADIQAREALDRAASSLTATPAPKAGRTTVTGGTVVAYTSASHGFKNPGEFYRSVVNAKVTGNVDPRLVQNAVSTYGNETTGADGGYALPPDFRAGINTMLDAPESLVSRLDQIFTPNLTITMPMDEDAPWAAAGIQVGAVSEGAAYSQTKPVLKTWTATLAKIGGLISVSEEALQDGTQLGPYIQKKAADKIAYALNSSIITAIGAAGNKIAVAKQASEAVGAAPGLATLLKMWSQMHTQFRKNAVWLANPALETALMQLQIGNYPAYLPAGGLSSAPYGTFLGKPVIYVDGLAAQGTTGCIFLVDPSSFFAVLKSNGVQAEMTPYFAWDQDLLSFKISTRAVFKSKWSATITRPDTTTASAVLTHATF